MNLGQYCVATKYSDGDAGDHFVVGFYNGSFQAGGETRHMVRDSSGQNFRNNGFRRVEAIEAERGERLVSMFPVIEANRNRYSVWDWVHAPWGDWLG